MMDSQGQSSAIPSEGRNSLEDCGRNVNAVGPFFRRETRGDAVVIRNPGIVGGSSGSDTSSSISGLDR